VEFNAANCTPMREDGGIWTLRGAYLHTHAVFAVYIGCAALSSNKAAYFESGVRPCSRRRTRTMQTIARGGRNMELSPVDSRQQRDDDVISLPCHVAAADAAAYTQRVTGVCCVCCYHY
jgi:hypothetical protein